jgi:hypothetical protein
MKKIIQITKNILYIDGILYGNRNLPGGEN